MLSRYYYCSRQEFEDHAKAVRNLVLKMKNNYLERAEQTDIKRSPYPVIVCGDFNDTPASYIYHRVRNGLTDGFQDAGNGYQYTFRQLYGLWRIDYVFYSESLKGQDYFSPDVSYSDHNMVVWRGCVKN